MSPTVIEAATRVGTAAALLLAAAACAGTADDTPPEDASESRIEQPDPTKVRPRCDGRAFAGRPYILCAPETGGGEVENGRPLVLALHGRGGSAEQMRSLTALEDYAADEGIVLVYASGANGGWSDDTFRDQESRDGEYLLDLLAHLADMGEADASRVGVIGMSNGGSMALRMVSEYPSRFVAAGVVAGQLPRDPGVQPRERVPILMIYGTADELRSYEDGIAGSDGRELGDPTPSFGVADSIEAFVEAATSDVEVVRHDIRDADSADGTALSTTEWYDSDGILAILHRIEGGGHTWPQGRLEPSGDLPFGRVSQELDASEAVVSFVATHLRAKGRR